MKSKITRIEVVRIKGGWQKWRILFWRGKHVQVYRYQWSRMNLILACLRFGEWTQKSGRMDVYERLT